MVGVYDECKQVKRVYTEYYVSKTIVGFSKI